MSPAHRPSLKFPRSGWSSARRYSAFVPSRHRSATYPQASRNIPRSEKNSTDPKQRQAGLGRLSSAPRASNAGKLPKTMAETHQELSSKRHKQQVNQGRDLNFIPASFPITSSAASLSKTFSDKHFSKGCPSKIIFWFYCSLINTRHAKP